MRESLRLEEEQHTFNWSSFEIDWSVRAVTPLGQLFAPRAHRAFALLISLQRCLIALSERPKGKRYSIQSEKRNNGLEIMSNHEPGRWCKYLHHLFLCSANRDISCWSSSFVQGVCLMSGFRWFKYLSRHCLPVRDCILTEMLTLQSELYTPRH